MQQLRGKQNLFGHVSNKLWPIQDFGWIFGHFPMYNWPLGGGIPFPPSLKSERESLIYPGRIGSSGIFSRNWSKAILKSSIEHFSRFLIFEGRQLNNVGPTICNLSSHLNAIQYSQVLSCYLQFHSTLLMKLKLIIRMCSQFATQIMSLKYHLSHL